ncbi:hypothetical protein G6F42_025790 [Rhizopus arrhizus]|nr:hypothetical protein G6F42_025790 [Rhizopus arrhizus]
MTQQQQPLSVSDLTQLTRDPSSDELAELLRQRYLNDVIYTNISPSILIAVNPYHPNSTVKADYIADS